MKTICRLLVCLAVAGAVAWSSRAVASGRSVGDIEQLMKGASKVVVATADAVEPQWKRNSFGDQLIVSQVHLKVEETLQGAADGDLSMEIEGGTLNGVTMVVSSQQGVAAGERGVFMLDESTSDSTYVPHFKGLGILKLNRSNRVQGSGVSLDVIRGLARQASK